MIFPLDKSFTFVLTRIIHVRRNKLSLITYLVENLRINDKKEWPASRNFTAASHPSPIIPILHVRIHTILLGCSIRQAQHTLLASLMLTQQMGLE